MDVLHLPLGLNLLSICVCQKNEKGKMKKEKKGTPYIKPGSSFVRAKSAKAHVVRGGYKCSLGPLVLKMDLP